MSQIMSGIARSSLLVDLSISMYSGRKQDTSTRDEVTASKGAKSKRAASVYKSLFADCKELDDITKFQARLRQQHYKYTKPWLDSGVRMLPATLLQQYQDVMYDYEQEFDALVSKFLDKYDTLVAAAAFQLGGLFDRAEYPLRSEVRRKFSFNLTYTPMPTSGDFRLDIETETQAALAAEYEKSMQAMAERAARDSWDKLHVVLSRLAKQLAPRGEDGKPGKIYDSLLGNAYELCELLRHFNVTGDVALESMRKQLMDIMEGVNTEALRKEVDTRAVVHKKVQELLDQHDWGIDDDGRVLDYDAEGQLVIAANLEHGMITHRYSVEGDVFSLQSYAAAMVTTGRGMVGEESDWLKRILDVAYLGGHGLTIVSTPPDFVLWFETDAKMDLLRFIVEAEELNSGV
jgi:hypothetical protein